MSDLGLFDNVDPNTPAGQEYLRGALRGVGIGTTNLPVGALGTVIPATENKQGNVSASAPAFLTGAYGGLGTLVPALLNNPSIGLQRLGITQKQVPELPGARTALEQAAGSERLAADIIPHVEAQNPGEEVVQAASRLGGSALVPIPGKLFEGLGQVGSKIADFVVPNTSWAKAAPALAVAGGTLTGVAEDAEAKSAQRSQQPIGNFDASQTYSPPPPSNGRFDQNQSYGPPPSGAIQPVGAFDSSQDYGVGKFNQGQQPPAGVDFGRQTGYDWQSLGERALEVAGGLAAAWVVLKHGGEAWTDASSMLRTGEMTADAAHAAENTAFNQQLDQLRQSGAVSSATPGTATRGEAPLPGTAGTPFTRAAQNTIGPAQVAERYMEAVAPNVAKQFSAQTGTALNNQSMGRRIQSMFATGIDPASKMQMPIVTDWANRIVGLDADKQDLLRSAMYAKGEVFDRSTKLQPGERFNFVNTPTDELVKTVNLAESDPVLKDLMDTAWTLGDRNLDVMLARRYISQSEYNLLKKQQPYYVPSVDNTGRITHVFEKRDITPGSGWDLPPTDPWSAIIQHQDSLYREMTRNDWVRTVVKNGMQYQQGDPSAARLFERKAGQADPAERAITIRDVNGPETYYVNNTSMYNTLQGSPARYNLANGIAQNTRRWVQSGTTGPASLLFNRGFLGTGAIRNFMDVPVHRTAGTYGSLEDMALQKMGLPGIRMPGPSSLIGVPLSTAADVAAVMGKNIGTMLSTRGNPVSMLMRNWKGDQWTDALAHRMSNYYALSSKGEQHAGGFGGAGALGGAELPTMSLTGAPTAARNAIGTQAPGAMGPTTIPFTKVPIPGANAFINLKSMFEDVYQTIMDGTHSYYYKLNKMNPNLTPEQLVHETSQVIGDPGVRGTGKTTNWLANTIPYYNVSLQDAARMARVFRDNPIGFTAGTIGTLAIPAMASILSGLISGPQAVRHLEQSVSTAQRAGNVVLYHPSEPDPTVHTEISLPQRWRWIYPMVLEMAATALNAFDAHSNEDLLSRTLDTVGDLFSHHISNTTGVSTAEGAGQFVGFVQPPPLASGAYGALTGKELRPQPDIVARNIVTGQPLLKGTSFDTTPQRQIPGVQLHDQLLSDNDGATVHAMLSALFGAAGSSVADMMRNYGIRSDAGVDHPILDTIGDYTQGFKDQTPYANIVWGNQIRASMSTPLEASVRRSLDAMKATAGADQAAQSQGMTRPGGLPVAPIGNSKLPDDPTIRHMFMVTSRVYSMITVENMPMINDLMKQRDVIGNSPHSAEMRRFLLNDVASKLQLRYEQIDRKIAALNSALSQMVGAPVDVRSINWKRDASQFQH